MSIHEVTERLRRAEIALGAFSNTPLSQNGVTHLLECQLELIAAVALINQRIDQELTHPSIVEASK
jgi:hypothetical protein